MDGYLQLAMAEDFARNIVKGATVSDDTHLLARTIIAISDALRLQTSQAQIGARTDPAIIAGLVKISDSCQASEDNLREMRSCDLPFRFDYEDGLRQTQDRTPGRFRRDCENGSRGMRDRRIFATDEGQEG